MLPSIKLLILVIFTIIVLFNSIRNVTDSQENKLSEKSESIPRIEITQNLDPSKIKIVQQKTILPLCPKNSFNSQVNNIKLPIYQFTPRDISPIVFPEDENITISPETQKLIKNWRNSEKTKVFSQTRAQINSQFSNEIQSGGYWSPEENYNCKSRSKLAVIIPFRSESEDYNIGREQELSLFLVKMIPFLQQQMIEFKIFVINQLWGDKFNRARLLNIGFVEASKNDNFDCFLTTDVDKFPVNLNVSYHCQNKNFYGRPIHYTPSFGSYGGVAQFSGESIKAINGFSNKYFGWGGEDQDIGFRFNNANNYAQKAIEKLIIQKLGEDCSKVCINNFITKNSLKNPFTKMTLFGEFQSTSFIYESGGRGGGRDKGNERNPERKQLMGNFKKNWPRDGLNSLEYDLKKIVNEPLLTRLFVDFSRETDGKLNVKEVDLVDLVGKHPCLRSLDDLINCNA